MADAGLIRTGGAFIELVLDHRSAIVGLKQFESEFRKTQAVLSRTILGSNVASLGVASKLTSRLRTGLAEVFTGNLFESAFLRLGQRMAYHIGRALRGELIQSLGTSIGRIGSNLTRGGFLGFLAGGVLTKGLLEVIKASSQAEQQMGRFQSVLGASVNQAEQFAQVLSGDINQSVLELRDELATFQSVIQGAGFNNTDAFDISKILVRATQDLLAFDDTMESSKEAVDRLLSGLAGEVRPVARFGADVRKNAFEQQLLALGINKASNEVSQQERVLTRLLIIMRALGSAGVIGQAQAEVQTLASLFRGLAGEVKLAMVAIGDQLAPAAAAVLRTMQLMARAVATFARANPQIVLAAGISVVALTALSLTSVSVGFTLIGLGAIVRAVGASFIVFTGPVKAATTAIQIMAGITGGFVAAVNLLGGALLSTVNFLGTLLSQATSAAVAVSRLTYSIAVAAALDAKALFSPLAAAIGSIGKAVLVSLPSLAAFTARLALIGAIKTAVNLFYLAGALHTLAYYPIAGITTLVASLEHVGVALKVITIRAATAGVSLTKSLLAAAGSATVAALKGVLSLLIYLGTSGVSAILSIGSAFLSVGIPIAAFIAVVAGAVAIFQRLAPVAQNAFGAIASGVRQAFGGIKSVLASFWQDVKAGFSNIVADGKAAFSAIATFVSAGDLSSAFSTLTAFLRIEFAKTVAYLVQQAAEFSAGFQTQAINGFYGVLEVASDVASRISVAWTALTELLGAAITPVLSVVLSAFDAIGVSAEAAFGSARAVFNSLWEDNIDASLQIKDLIVDGFTVAINSLLNLWDRLAGAVERTGVRIAALFDDSIDVASELEQLTKRRDRNINERQDRQNEEVLARERARKEKQAQIDQERAAKLADIQAAADQRALQFDQKRDEIKRGAAAALVEASRRFEELKKQAADVASGKIEVNVDREGLLNQSIERIQELLRAASGGGKGGLGNSARLQESAFADIAKFALGGSDQVQQEQLRTQKQIAKEIRRALEENARPLFGIAGT